MRILVCVKQTPELGNVRMQAGTGSIDRGGESVINPFDLYAMEAAVCLKEADSTVDITVLSMGPLSAESVLKDCLAFGADHAFLISSPAFAGADIRATAYILKAGIEMLEREQGPFDAIFCGSKTTDGGSAMLPPYLAELLRRSAATKSPRRRSARWA